MRCPTTVLLLLLSTLTMSSTARAYGPMTHMGEAEAAAARLAEEQVDGLAEVGAAVAGDPVVWVHLMLGAILPDLREAAASIQFHTHNRPFARHLLLNVATDPAVDMDLRAVALGLASHVCSDVAAQVFAVPMFAADGQVGAADVMVGLMDDRPDGENELLVEAVLDVYFGDVQSFLGLYDHFQPDPPQPARLVRALDFWLGEAAGYFGAGSIGDATAIKVEIADTLGRVAAQLTPERRDLFVDAVDMISTWPLADVVAAADGLGLLDELVTQGYEVEVDYVELFRLQDVSPFFGDEHHFDGYVQWLHALGPAILADEARGVPWLDTWPVWHPQPLAVSTVQSLAGLDALDFGRRADIGIFDLWWEDADSGEPLTAVDTADPPARVRLVATLFPYAPTTTPVLLQIRKSGPATTDYGAGPVLAATRVDLDWSPLTWAGQAPVEVTVEATLDASALIWATGLHAELATPVGDDATPVFTTSWEPFARMDGWDMDRAVYADQFSSFDHWPAGVAVAPMVEDLSPPGAPGITLSATALTDERPAVTITLGARDPESGIARYELSLGTVPGGADLLDATTVPATGFTREGRLIWTAPQALLTQEGTMYVTARAVNTADLTGPDAEAGPILMGTPPEPPDDGGGCDCRASNGGAGGWLLVLFGLIWRMRRRRRDGLVMGGAILAVGLGIGLAGCEKSASIVNCQTIMDERYLADQTVAGEDGEALEHDAAVTLCLDLQANLDCTTAFDRWLLCVDTADSADASPLCPRELRATVACRDEANYEYHCDDAQDGDDDGTVDCADTDCLDSPWCAFAGDRVNQSGEAAVDVLFVVDYHDSMAEERAALGAAMSYLLDRLRDADGALPDVHIGFTTPTLGVGGQNVPDCPAPGSNASGRLDAGGCTGMGGANYLVDVAPRGCSAQRDPTFGRCTSHDCLPQHCDHETQANLVEDEKDCPRCRNFGLLPENLFDCAAGIATTSCPFRQPLEAARLALDDHPDNTGFVRDRAHLAVVVVSNVDDCSASDPALFDGADASLGPLGAFRCFEQGVACTQTGRDPGPRTGCATVADGNDLLYPVARYIDYLQGMRHPAQLTVAALTGPIIGDGADVTTDASGLPILESSCDPTFQHATPAFRLRTWSDHFNDIESDFWPFSPICGELGAALQGVGENVAAALAHRCPAAPLTGCSDPGAAAGEGWDDETCNDDCAPQCWVVEATDHGLPQESRTWLPHCRRVCAEGLCLDNTDPAEAYAGGHPDLRDPDLPVDACWHVVSDPLCTDARGANVAIARRADPPLRTFAYIDCALLSVSEELCGDGEDDDGDCLIDLDDPDCGL